MKRQLCLFHGRGYFTGHEGLRQCRVGLHPLSVHWKSRKLTSRWVVLARKLTYLPSRHKMLHDTVNAVAGTKSINARVPLVGPVIHGRSSPMSGGVTVHRKDLFGR